MTQVGETLVEFPFEPRTASGPVPHDSLVIKVDGPQETTAQAISRSDGFFISFLTTTTGIYKVSITYNGENVVRSPVTVSVKARDSDEDEGQKPEPPSEDPQKHTVKFQVDAKDKDGKIIHGNTFTAEITGPEEIHGIQIEPMDGGKLLVSFETAITSGDFSVAIKLMGEHIERSPFTVTLSKPEDGEKSRGDEIATLEPEDDARTIQFKVEAKMSDGASVSASELNATVESGPDTGWDPRVVDEDGQLLVSFKTRTLGNYTVSVTRGNQHISGSPFNLQM